MTDTPDPLDEDHLGLTNETLDQWESELDDFAVQIMQRLKALAMTDPSATQAGQDENDLQRYRS